MACRSMRHTAILSRNSCLPITTDDRMALAEACNIRGDGLCFRLMAFFVAPKKSRERDIVGDTPIQHQQAADLMSASMSLPMSPPQPVGGLKASDHLLPHGGEGNRVEQVVLVAWSCLRPGDGRPGRPRTMPVQFVSPAVLCPEKVLAAAVSEPLAWLRRHLSATQVKTACRGEAMRVGRGESSQT